MVVTSRTAVELSLRDSPPLAAVAWAQVAAASAAV
jgi:hypothetical protein